jgi:hypothetical protein
MFARAKQPRALAGEHVTRRWKIDTGDVIFFSTSSLLGFLTAMYGSGRDPRLFRYESAGAVIATD